MKSKQTLESLLVLVLIAAISSVFIIYIYFTVPANTYPNINATYTIFRDGDYIGVMKWDSRTVVYNSSNASDAINKAVKNCTDGGSVFIKADTYCLGSPITIEDKDYFTLYSDGALLNNIGTDYAIKVLSLNTVIHRGNVIDGLRIEGNGNNHGILVVDSFRTILRDLYIKKVDIGIKLENINMWTEGTQIINVHVQNPVKALTFSEHTGFDSTCIDGFYINLWRQNSFGIYVADTRLNNAQWQRMKIWFLSNNTYGIFLETNASYVQLENSIITEFDCESFVDSPLNVIGIRVGTFDVHLMKVNFWGSFTNKIFRGGAGKVYTKWVPDYVTENSGNTTVANNEWILHGLAETPTTVIITCKEATYDGQPAIVSWINQNSTMFQVSVYWTNGTTITSDAIRISWYAKM